MGWRVVNRDPWVLSPETPDFIKKVRVSDANRERDADNPIKASRGNVFGEKKMTMTKTKNRRSWGMIVRDYHNQDRIMIRVPYKYARNVDLLFETNKIAFGKPRPQYVWRYLENRKDQKKAERLLKEASKYSQDDWNALRRRRERKRYYRN